MFVVVVALVVQIHAFQSLSTQQHHHRQYRDVRSRLHSTTESSSSKAVNVKYPTSRGSEVDSRLFINYKKKTGTSSSPSPPTPSDGSSSSYSTSSSTSPLLALRVSHILFASRELATQTLDKLTSATANTEEWNFEHVAKSISNCAETRDEGGEVGWVNLNEEFSSYDTYNNEDNNDDDDNAFGNSASTDVESERRTTINNNPNQHLDLILPPTVRKHILSTPNKPGDILLARSYRGVHLVQIVDVMVDVRKLSYIKANKKKSSMTVIQNEMELGVQQSYTSNNNLEQQQQRITNDRGGTKLAGILGGALIDKQSQSSQSTTVDLTYKIETMGCQMNLADSERIEGQLMNLGIRPLLNNETTLVPVQLNNGTMRMKSKPKEPDVVILNTCSIRDHAEQKVYSYLGPYTKRKRAGEDITIIVAGCVAQQEGQELLRRIPEIDLVMGPQYANRIADLLEDVANGNQVVATEASHIMEDSTKPRRLSSTCAWVNVIYGCNERCTYCIVPTTRGVEQSRPIESIVDEIKELVSKGYKEVTLLGQNIDAYGRDMLPKRKFSDLIRIVGETPGLERLRFVTSHPRYMSLGCVDAVADTKAACEYFHVPFQSGSNNILQAMGRGHTRERFLSIIDRIRERLPDAGISADCIVGFPGETEQDFLETLALMEEVKFDNVNTAAYSPRPNTPAATWTNQISEDVKQDRLRRINELNLQHATERRARMLHRVVEVLVEERNVKNPTQVMGRTTHGYIVYVDGDIDELRGKLVNVKVHSCQRYYLVGKIADDNA